MQVFWANFRSLPREFMMNNLTGVQGSQCVCQLASQMMPHLSVLSCLVQSTALSSLGSGKGRLQLQSVLTHEILLWVLLHCRLLVYWANDAIRQHNSGKAQFEFHSGFPQVRRNQHPLYCVIRAFSLWKANMKLHCRLVAVQLMFNLKAINLQTVRHHELPDCYDFTLTVCGRMSCVFQFKMRNHSCWFTVLSQCRCFLKSVGHQWLSPVVSGLLCHGLVYPVNNHQLWLWEVQLWVFMMGSWSTCLVYDLLYSNPSEV